MEQTIVLRWKYQDKKESIFFLLLFIASEIILGVAGWRLLLLTPLVVWLVIFWVIKSSFYVLKIKDGLLCQHLLEISFYRKILDEFEVTAVDRIEIRQDEKRYYYAQLILKDGREVFLVKYPTKDMVEGHKKAIELKLGLTR